MGSYRPRQPAAKAPGGVELNPPPDLGPRYELVQELGRGAMSVVYEARDRERERACAVKVLAVPDGWPASVVERFEREVALAARLGEHPGIVAAWEAGTTPAGELFCVLELVEGETLEQHLARSTSLERRVELVLDVARAVAYAHERGVIHRDLKPANVLVTGEGRARLSDFGISKALDAGEGLTATGDRLGTPCYMAPEQVEDSKRVDERTDVYGLGAILYEVITDHRPFAATSVLEVLRQVVREPPRPPRELAPEVDPELEALCLRALRKDPAERPASAALLADALAEWLDRRRAAAAPDPRLGSVVAGRYELVERLGGGGFGAVYRGRPRDGGEEVAVKVLHPERSASPEARARFQREVAAAGAVDHPGLVRVRESGELEAGELYLVMDLVPGETLAARLRRRGRLPAREVLALARQALDALAAAHDAGLVHRDVKPANLMVADGPEGRRDRAGADAGSVGPAGGPSSSADREAPVCRVLDFGVAKAVASVDAEADDAGLTRTGAAPGTPRYMSPEQAAGDPVDARSDLYSLAAVLYECLAGRPPLLADSRQRFLWKLATEEPPPLRRFAPAAPPALVAAIERNLAKDRGARHEDARAFRAALDAAPAARSAPEERPSGRLRAGSVGAGASGAAPRPGAEQAAPLDVLLGRASDEAGGRAPAAAVAGVALAAALGVLALDLGGARSALLGAGTPPAPPASPSASPPPGGSPAPLPPPAATPPDRPAPSPAPPTPAPAGLRLVELRPADGSLTAAAEVVVAGRVAPATAGEVRVGQAQAPLAADGSFALALALPDGAHDLEVLVVPAAGEPLRARLSVGVDRTPPEVALEEPAEGLVTDARRVRVAGTARDASALTVRVDGEVLDLRPDTRGRRRFGRWYELQAGEARAFAVEVRDAAGNALTLRRVVQQVASLEGAPPAAPAGPRLPAGVTAGDGAFRNARDGSPLVYLPPGRFVMGPDRGPDPQREVQLTRGFFLGRHEVTWGQYRAFSAATGRAPPSADLAYDGPSRFTLSDEHPVWGVSWDEARAYAEWAGGRLPTEAEWEYAAGGAEGRRYPWGDRFPLRGDPVANVAPPEDLSIPGYDDGHPLPTPVGALPAGAAPCGALDMSGNVDEWVADWFGVYDPRERVDPTGPPRGDRRVYRGGSWRSPLRDGAVTARSGALPSYRNDHLGFRICLDEPR